MNIKKGDTIVVLSGKDKGKQGKILKSDPKGGKVIVEGVNVAMKHRKPRKQGEEGGIVKMETPIYACPSGEVRYVRMNCKATIGQVSNLDHENVKIGSAGRKRHMGWRPTVRGSVMNPVDHPHGGGEGKSPIGRPGPVTPWGKPTLGYKTRKTKARTEKFIVKHRNSK